MTEYEEYEEKIKYRKEKSKEIINFPPSIILFLVSQTQ